VFPLFQKTAQIDLAKGGCRCFKPLAQGDLLADLVDHAFRYVEGLRLAVDQHGNLVLGMQGFAVGAVTVRSPAGASILHKRAGQHFAEPCETSEELTAGLQIGIASHRSGHSL
jgi:hypothetical protein